MTDIVKINFVRHAKYTFFVTETESWMIFMAVIAVYNTKHIYSYFGGLKV